MFSKLAAEIISKKTWLVLTTDSAKYVFFTHMKNKNLFIISSDCSSFIHGKAPNVIKNLCRKKDDSIAAVYDNEWYPGIKRRKKDIKKKMLNRTI